MITRKLRLIVCPKCFKELRQYKGEDQYHSEREKRTMKVYKANYAIGSEYLYTCPKCGTMFTETELKRKYHIRI
jgi:protein-arginine kinase activator protein McsA